MYVLYSKNSMDRRKEFQIWTSIASMRGKIYAMKKPVHQEGIAHIKAICSNGEALKAVCEAYIDSSVYENNMAVTPYVEGISLSEKLRERLENKENVAKLISQWKEIIIGSETNFCDFEVTQGFRDIFGEAEELAGDIATRISNLDCSGDNILYLSDDQIRVIDYEWVFQFPVPVELLFYRVLKLFYEHNRGCADWNCLLECSGIDRGKTGIYERLMQRFQDYVCKDPETGIDYSMFGRRFKESKVIENHQKAAFSFRFPFEIIPPGCSLVLYGAGRVGTDYYHMIKATGYCSLVLWIDQQAAGYQKQGVDVSDKSALSHAACDYILIAVMNESVYHEIRCELMQSGIPEDKIVWTIPDVI